MRMRFDVFVVESKGLESFFLWSSRSIGSMDSWPLCKRG